jgi:uncharacterized protein (DUF427 family)
VRAVFGGETVVDNHSVKLLHETGHLSVYYLPEEDLRGDLLEPTDHTTHCPFKGDASYRSVRVEDRIAEYAVWTYPEPLEDAPPILGYVALYHDAMDKWLEEDEEVFGHPHDPYHRVDVLESSRHVRVSLNGEVVAETKRPKILFETGLPPRYYIPPEDVRTDLLVPSETKTVCPYKGVASSRTSSGTIRSPCPKPRRSRITTASTTRRSTSRSKAEGRGRIKPTPGPGPSSAARRGPSRSSSDPPTPCRPECAAP